MSRRPVILAAVLLAGMVTALPAQAQTVVSYTGPTRFIFDGPGFQTAILRVGGLGVITDLDVRFDALAGCDGAVNNPAAPITHDAVGQLSIKLRSPAGTLVTLIDHRGGARDNICQLLLDEDAGFPSLSTATSQNGQALSGSFAPDGLLAAFDGQNPNGEWALVVEDTVAGDEGNLNRFSLILTTAAIPEIVVDVLTDPAPNGCTPGHCSLREAVDLANLNVGMERIVLPPNAQLALTRAGAEEDLNVTGDLDIAEEIELLSRGTEPTSIEQTAADRLLDQRDSGRVLAVRNVALRGGRGVQRGGAIRTTRVRLEDCALLGNTATEQGGALVTAYATIRRCRFENNTVSGNNDGDDGGAIRLADFLGGTGPGDLIVDLEDSVFAGNQARRGGAIYAGLTSTLDFNNPFQHRYEGLTFTGNTALQGGGALYSNVSPGLQLRACTFSGNASTSDSGGAIYGAARPMAAIDSTFEENSAGVAGGAAFGVDVERSTLCRNTAASSGGALAFPRTVKRSTFCNNRVTADSTGPDGQGEGGAIRSTGSLLIERSTFVNNSGLLGGTISAGSTISGTSTVLRGNTITTSTIQPVGHTATALRLRGGGADSPNSLFNNILAGSCSHATGAAPDVAVGNIEAPGNSCRLWDAPLQVLNQINASSASIALGALNDNGGPTETRLPGPNSIAVSGGSNNECPPDQRGYGRVDTCDVGAVEVGAAPPVDALFANGFE